MAGDIVSMLNAQLPVSSELLPNGYVLVRGCKVVEAPERYGLWHPDAWLARYTPRNLAIRRGRWADV